MSAAVENGCAPGCRSAAALPYGALSSYRLHLVPHVSVLQIAVDEFADAGSVPELQRSTRILQNLGSRSYARNQSACGTASDLCGVVHNEQSPSILGNHGGESVKASSFPATRLRSFRKLERGHDVSRQKKPTHV